MIIHAVSDLHGFKPNLPGGDLLIVAGDCTGGGRINEWIAFARWLDKLEYDRKIVVAGNHDNFLVDRSDFLCFCGESLTSHGIDYLCDSGLEYRGLKIWGSPWTSWFQGVNPLCKAFMTNEETLHDKFNLIPQDTDILITHSPPIHILDDSIRGDSCGSPELTYAMPDNVKLHIFGHIHECGNQYLIDDTTYVNASFVNRQYKPQNEYMEIILDDSDKIISVSAVKLEEIGFV